MTEDSPESPKEGVDPDRILGHVRRRASLPDSSSGAVPGDPLKLAWVVTRQ
jgi:hypothetical protein